MRASKLILSVLLGGVALASASKCTGTPPTYNGLPCATTTRYWDDQEGACGCGTSAGPYSWSYTSYTAAASDLLFGHDSTWCGSGCGTCWELTPTGDCTDPTSDCVSSLDPITIMITNLCPNSGNEEWCPIAGSYNEFGYGQHFDLMDENLDGKITALGWNNPVVTYKQVACGSGGSPTCADADMCDCTDAATACADFKSSNSTTTKSSTTGSSKTSTTTHKSTTATTHSSTTTHKSTTSTTGRHHHE